jgi:hypothetical protein
MLYEQDGRVITAGYIWPVEQVYTGPGDFHEMQALNTRFIAMYIVITNFVSHYPLLNKELYFNNIIARLKLWTNSLRVSFYVPSVRKLLKSSVFQDSSCP